MKPTQSYCMLKSAMAPATAAMLIATMSAAITIGGCASPWRNESAALAEQGSKTALRIKAALIAHPALAGSAIDVEFAGGRAVLGGFVETRKQFDIAAAVARDQQGVSRVVNEIVVK